MTNFTPNPSLLRALLLSASLSCVALTGACQPKKQSDAKGAPPSASPVNTSQSADTLITAERIYSGLSEAADLKQIAVKDGRIQCVSSALECERFANSGTKRLNFTQGAVYPGFTDAHAHLLGIGERELTLNLEGTKSLTELGSRVRAYIDAKPDAQVIFGRGWIETHWPEGRFPTALDLDAISKDIPIILTRADGHASVVNSAALEAANISAKTTAPFGGEILRGANGAPTGMLIDNAQSLVAPILPRLDSAAELKDALKMGNDVYTAYGWTGVHSMSVSLAEVSAMGALSEAGQLSLRVYNSVDTTEAMPALPARADMTTGRVTTRAIKLYSDGALGSRGAALLAPYDDDPQNSGLITLKEEETAALLRTALREGIQVNTHAIGDRGNQLVLSLYEQAFAAVPEAEREVASPRWRVEHAQILSLDDIPRFKALGVIPSMQPSHAIGDLHFAVDRIGTERLKGGYSWRSLIDSGVIIAGGSDAPVERGDPRIEFYAAVARKDMSGFSGQGWYPEQAVTRLEALKMFTSWPAFAAFNEAELGTLEVGKLADLTVFGADIMTIPEAEILTAPIIATIINGDVVYSAQ